MRFVIPFLVVLAAIVTAAFAAEEPSSAGASEIEALTARLADMEARQAESKAEIDSLKARIRTLEAGRAPESELERRRAMEAEASAARSGVEPAPYISGLADQTVRSQLSYRDATALNPSMSAVIDTFYHADDSGEGISHTLEEMLGFGHAHGAHGHEHHGTDEGFNLRHVELAFSADVDPYFKAWAIAAVDVEGAEIEEAAVQTTSLPGGLQVQGGKFFSAIGRINAQHQHDMDFVDRPLIHELVFGSHGLNEKGVQVSWLAPTPFYLLAGVEAFQGENERMFNHIGDDPLDSRSGPRVLTEYVKYAPNLPGYHGAQFGAFAGQGRHQEEHDGDGDGTSDHWLDGCSQFYGADAVYKYDDPRQHGQGDWIVQAEYLRRTRDLEVEAHDLNPALVGENRVDRQDGLYAQTVYGFAPRWRAGLRYDVAGILNRVEEPDGTREKFDASNRVSLMADFSPSEFSRLRAQVSRGKYETEDGEEDVWEFFLQLVISLGAHGAHKF